MIHYKFPHIEQLKNVLVSLKHKYQNPIQTSDGWVFDETLPLPTIEFYGTVKLHGSNTAIVVDLTNSVIYAQSREAILTPEADYKGFARFVESLGDKVIGMLPACLRVEALSNKTDIVVYGEWCGKGVQDSVAISQLPRMFVIFAVKIGNRWCGKEEFSNIQLEDSQVYNIFRAPHYRAVINFNDIHESMTKDIYGSLFILDDLSKMTQDVEAECPFAKSFGVSGVGEGIVWRAICDARTKAFCGGDDGDPWMFKVKGDKHKNVKEKKVIQLSSDVTESNDQLISSVLTEQRLNQGIEKLGEMGLEASKKNTQTFLKWIQDDIRRENRDILEAQKLSEVAENTLFRDIQKQARDWFFKQPGV